MHNPFFLKLIPDDQELCDRQEEMALLEKRAKSNTMVVLYSPRRYGKTTMALKLQQQLRAQKWLTVFVDFMGISSMEETAQRIAAGTYRAIHQSRGLMTRAGKGLASLLTSFSPLISYSPLPGQEFKVGVQQVAKVNDQVQLLDSVLTDLGRLIKKLNGTVLIVFDEFQEIRKAGAEKIEKTMRSHMQHHQAPYLILGSRRHLLLNMFTSKNRAFYHMGLLMQLKKLPQPELIDYIVERFKAARRDCPQEVARQISELSACHPFYSQNLSYMVYELCDKQASSEMVTSAMQSLLDEQSHLFISDIDGLSPGQLDLVKQLALSQPAKPYSKEFMTSSGLLPGTISKALKKLEQLDIIEATEGKTYRIVDPMLAEWLKQKAW